MMPGAKNTDPSRDLFYQYLAGLKPTVPEYALVSVEKYLSLILDFRKTELSRIRRQLKKGKRKSATSRFLEQIDSRINECCLKLMEWAKEIE